jgi:hypothetical protein
VAVCSDYCLHALCFYCGYASFCCCGFAQSLPPNFRLFLAVGFHAVAQVLVWPFAARRLLDAAAVAANEVALPQEKEKNIETTQEEMEGFFIVKSMLRTLINPNRITFRDAQSYFAIMLDDNNRKPICRLHLNGTKKFITTFDSSKKDIKTEIQSLDDIYNFTEQLKATVETYLA